ncbi:MAG: hypothetical protein ACI87E_004773 [Mariniblastus sp.]|jgi:hypothetical protein
MERFPIKNFLFGIAGAVIGGAVASLVFYFVAQQGFYMGAIPGAGIGIGFSMGARKRHLAFGLTSGIMALAIGLLSDWILFPNADSFFEHVAGIDGWVTWAMVILGTVLGFQFGIGRDYPPALPSRSNQANSNRA